MNFKSLPLALMLILSVAVLAACGGSDDTSTAASSAPITTLPDVPVDTENLAPYPQKIKDEFLKSCYASSGGKKAMCGCILTAFEDTVPPDDFNAINHPKDGVAPPPTPTATKDAANACVEAAS